MRQKRTLLPLGFAAMLAIAACSSDADSSSSTDSEATESTAGESSSDSSAAETTVGSDGTDESDGFETGDDVYRITFDGEPTEGTLDAEAVGAESSTRTVTRDNGDFQVVSDTDLIDPGAASLDGMVTGTQQSVGGDEPVVEVVSLNGWEGRRWSFEFEQGGLKGTYYAVGLVVDDSLLQVAYVDGGSDNESDANAFLDSLQVLTPGPG